MGRHKIKWTVKYSRGAYRHFINKEDAIAEAYAYGIALYPPIYME